MEVLYALLGLVAGLLLGRSGTCKTSPAPPHALPPDPQEDQWRALFSYEGSADRDAGEEDR